MQRAIDQLLRQPEGRHLEFKRAEADPRKVVRTVCAFANTAGGHVVIGVADDGQVLGVPYVASLEERYASVISDSIEPQLVVDLQRLRVGSQELLIIKVPRFPGCFRVAGPAGGVYIRQGSTTRLADHAKVRELEREAGALAWDEQRCVGSTLADIDLGAIESAYATVGRTLDEAKLRSLKLVVAGAGGEGPSNAAVVLFGSPVGRERLLPHVRFRCARFEGETKAEILDQFEASDGTLLGSLGGTRDDPGRLGPVRRFIRRNTRNRALIGQVLRRDVSEYADAILRELLPNAVAHADFSQRGMPLRVSIFSDRLEIENPGGWPVGFAEVDFKAGISKIRSNTVVWVRNA